jgi:formiminoglutamate deiminase
MTRWFAEHAWLPDGLVSDVLFEVEDDHFARVTAAAAPAGATRLPGVVFPGFANCHSHAFHRALRGHTHGGRGTFWTWRTQMYAAAARLDPDSYARLARATYAEMAMAGITAVGEFHYLHHGAGGRPYADPNAMGEALRQAAAAAGVRLTLLDTCYLAGGLEGDGHRPPDEVQQRFADADAEAWAARAAAFGGDANTRTGVAVHSVRAVPRAALGTVRAAAGDRPLHVHLSEQQAENDACRAYYGVTPTALLADAGVLDGTATAVHATHLTSADRARLAGCGSTVCLCPTTERDLADGIGPGGALADAGVPLSLGTDQHAVIDMFEEARALEMHERLVTQRRGRFMPGELVAALTRHDSLGWPDAGRLAAGARADLVAVRTDTVRTAGSTPAEAIFAASAADVDTVLVGGRAIVSGGRHVLGDVGRLLTEAIEAIWRD